LSTVDIRHRLSAIMMGVQGVAILGTWAGFLVGGSFKDGVRTVENNMYLGLHFVAEILMGLLLVVGSGGLLAKRSWGRIVKLLGLGSVIYSTINSMADTIRNKPALTPVLLVNLLLAILIAAVLTRQS
jgi:DMSO/TMAO reductase YedYZ heme-binding membrane subunit